MSTNSCLIVITIFLICLLKSSKSDNVEFGSQLSPSNQEKLTHLKFYFHDTVSGKNPTAMRIVQPPTTNASPTLFGFINMMDDPLTIGPDINSQLVGRSQGVYASASQTELAFLMVLNFVFVGGKYNGSTLSVLGRNRPLTTAVRELPIVGGSGVFRFSRGYAEARTHTLDLKTGDVVNEYNLYVMHY